MKQCVVRPSTCQHQDQQQQQQHHHHRQQQQEGSRSSSTSSTGSSHHGITGHLLRCLIIQLLPYGLLLCTFRHPTRYNQDNTAAQQVRCFPPLLGGLSVNPDSTVSSNPHNFPIAQPHLVPHLCKELSSGVEGGGCTSTSPTQHTQTAICMQGHKIHMGVKVMFNVTNQQSC